MMPCLGRGPTDSNNSIHSPGFCVFSVIWTIFFSLKANPNGMKTSDSGTVLAQGTPLLSADACKAGELEGIDRTVGIAERPQHGERTCLVSRRFIHSSINEPNPHSRPHCKPLIPCTAKLKILDCPKTM
jgi:hypothetical protein